MRSKIKVLQYAVTYAIYGATLNVLTCLLKPTKNFKMMMYPLGVASFVSEACLSQTSGQKNLEYFSLQIL